MFMTSPSIVHAFGNAPWVHCSSEWWQMALWSLCLSFRAEISSWLRPDGAPWPWTWLYRWKNLPSVLYDVLTYCEIAVLSVGMSVIKVISSVGVQWIIPGLFQVCRWSFDLWPLLPNSCWCVDMKPVQSQMIWRDHSRVHVMIAFTICIFNSTHEYPWMLIPRKYCRNTFPFRSYKYKAISLLFI